jgi:hypothetical protein
MPVHRQGLGVTPAEWCGGFFVFSIPTGSMDDQHGQELAGFGRKPQIGADGSVVYWT